MEQLPDDVLVQVMQYLSVDDVLACRLVCRRFEGPSMFREVWHRRRLVDDQRPCVCAALRLAPSLEAVLCSGHTSAFLATHCAVAELILVVEKDIHPDMYAQVVHNQEALGRLRRVEVRYAPGAQLGDRADPDPLSVTLVRSSCLESLVFPKHVPYAPSPIPHKHRPARSSLKIFKCCLNEVNEYFVDAVLAGHAPTLEEVDLDGGFPFALGTAKLLASMPKLERLKCDMIRDLEAVAACKTLKDMTLCIASDYYPYFLSEGAAEFLRRANHLHTLSIDFNFGDIDSGDRSLLLGALASSGGSLERLSVALLDEDELQPLIDMLPRLPALRLLSISVDCDLLDAEALAGITPATAPALRRLELLEAGPQFCCCLHEWLHDGDGNAVKILDANPSLHIHITEPIACKRRRCDACAQGCHRQAEWNERGRLVLFAHDPDDCSSPEDHTADSTWTCVQIRSTPD
ncbi:uncharacterized protein LOC113211237 [Frankliniella occidentalis]|uniref:Uncharacterized protein LOC113211237 n=1 Tax=Frankliniella occidentalis TaxID=133901 RepID=A0A6J1SVN8_FRAOC|nr:uncharacterized protein LOC113211237 [Frankliniella occidentalis]